MRRNLLTISILLFSLQLSTVYPKTAERNTAAHHVRTGMEQLKAGKHQEAKESFEQAVRYDDASAAAHLGLGISYYHLRDDRYAERELLRALELNPKEHMAHQFLGELYYRKDDFEAAIASWEKAIEINPSANGLRARLEKVRKEHHTEKDFNRDVTSHFLSKYEGREKIEAGRIVLRILEDAYGEVGRALSFYPTQEIQVILYSEQQFQDVTDAPVWSTGIYDGKIRIPIGGIERETPGLRRLLYHEYTHAVVRAITPRCPTWLNEGLAQYFEGRRIEGRRREALRSLATSGKLPRLANLEGSFMGLGTDQAGMAYLLSLSAVSYAIDDLGMYRVKMVLDELAKGASTDRALDAGFSRNYEEFERGWRRAME